MRVSLFLLACACGALRLPPLARGGALLLPRGTAVMMAKKAAVKKDGATTAAPALHSHGRMRLHRLVPASLSSPHPLPHRRRPHRRRSEGAAHRDDQGRRQQGRGYHLHLLRSSTSPSDPPPPPALPPGLVSGSPPPPPPGDRRQARVRAELRHRQGPRQDGDARRAEAGRPARPSWPHAHAPSTEPDHAEESRPSTRAPASPSALAQVEADKAEALAAAIAAKEAAEALKAKLEGVVAPEAEPEAEP